MEAVGERKNGFFSMRGRTSRKTFLKLVLPLLLFGCVGNLFSQYNSNLIYALVTAVISIVIWLCFIPLIIRRFHDSNYSWKILFITLGSYVCQVLTSMIDILLDLNAVNNFVVVTGYIVWIGGMVLFVLNLFFLLLKGTPQANRYGEPEALSAEEARQINLLCGGMTALSVVWAFIGYLLI